MAINLVITFIAKKEKLQSFKHIIDDLKVSLPKIKGCREVKLFHHLDDPLQFTVIEQWDSRELHMQHVEKLVSSGEWNLIAEHLQEDPVSGYYVEI